MTRYLLDTNIISDATKPHPSASLLAWLSERDDDELFISSLTIAEISRGILESAPGRKRALLERWFSGVEGPLRLFEGRVLAFDEDAALAWATFMAAGRAEGRPRSDLDMIIAATASSQDCVIVTDNERDFAGFEIVNPLRHR